MGNSEVGHTNLGAGRVVRQDLVRIDDDLESGAFFANPVLRRRLPARPRLGAAPARAGVRRRRAQPRPASARRCIELADRRGGRAGARARVHRRPRHLAHRRRGLPGGHPRGGDRVRPLLRHGPRSPLGPGQARLRRDRARHGRAGRRRRWRRVRARYEAGETDEFIQPIVIGDPAHGRIRAGDVAIFFNFRPDRARELTRTLIEPDFDEFDRGPGAAAAVPRADDGVRRGHPRAGGVRRRVAHRRCWRRPWRPPGSRSCTWPRPRSTPT